MKPRKIVLEDINNLITEIKYHQLLCASFGIDFMGFKSKEGTKDLILDASNKNGNYRNIYHALRDIEKYVLGRESDLDFLLSSKDSLKTLSDFKLSLEEILDEFRLFIIRHQDHSLSKFLGNDYCQELRRIKSAFKRPTLMFDYNDFSNLDLVLHRLVHLEKRIINNFNNLEPFPPIVFDSDRQKILSAFKFHKIRKQLLEKLSDLDNLDTIRMNSYYNQYEYLKSVFEIMLIDENLKKNDRILEIPQILHRYDEQDKITLSNFLKLPLSYKSKVLTSTGWDSRNVYSQDKEVFFKKALNFYKLKLLKTTKKLTSKDNKLELDDFLKVKQNINWLPNNEVQYFLVPYDRIKENNYIKEENLLSKVNQYKFSLISDLMDMTKYNKESI